MKKRTNRSRILTKKLEGIPHYLFADREYRSVIKQELKKTPGVYALYYRKKNKKENLYYVGRASSLLTRVKQHLKDRHSGKWTHCSVYFTKNKQCVVDIESIIISIAPTPGNRQKSSLGKDKKMKARIEKGIQEIIQERTAIGAAKENKNSSKKKRRKKKRISLKNYFERARPLKKEYKGKVYKAKLLKSGKIKYKGKPYDTPSAAAYAAIKRRSPNSKPNGWSFWSVKDNKNNWIKLSKLN